MIMLAFADNRFLLRQGMFMFFHEMSDLYRISERVLEVFQWIYQKFTTMGIAGKLFLNSRKVNSSCTKILLKIVAHNTAGIVVFAITKSYVTP